MILAILLLACGGPGPADTAEPEPAVDADGDGAPADADCDDADPSVHPGAPETWYDGIDADCAGDDDFDADADGWARDLDCQDGDPRAWPGGPERNCDQRDDNCDGLVSASDADCALELADAVLDVDVAAPVLWIGDDVTGDGLPDIGMHLSRVDLGGLEIRTGSFDALGPRIDGGGADIAWSTPAGDATGDGVPDVWVRRADDDAVLLAGPFVADRAADDGARLTGVGVDAYVVLDADGDGVTDVAADNRLCAGPLVADRALADCGWSGREASSERLIGAIDADGDGDDELLAADGEALLILDDGAVLDDPRLEPGGWDGSYPPVDGDGDGYLDFAFHGADGRTGVLYGPLVEAGRQPDVVVEGLGHLFSTGAGDVDDDGRSELFFGDFDTWILSVDAPGTWEAAEIGVVVRGEGAALVLAAADHGADGVAELHLHDPYRHVRVFDLSGP